VLQTPSCQFYPAASSSCLRRPTAHLFSAERGSLWVCVNKHLPEQDRRDREMQEQVMGDIWWEKGHICSPLDCAYPGDVHCD
jgi:hypothetical protein